MAFFSSQLLEVAKKFKFKLITLLSLVLLQTTLNIIAVVSLAPIIELFLKKKEEEFNYITKTVKKIFLEFNLDFQLLHSFILFGSLILITSLIGLWVTHLSLKIKYDIVSKIKIGMMDLFLKSDYSFFNLKKIGKFINTFELEVNKVCTALDELIKFIAALIQIVLLLLVPLFFSVKFTIIFFICICAVVSPMIFFKNYIYRLGKEDTISANEMNNSLYQILSSVKLIYSYGMNNSAKTSYALSAQRHIDVTILRQFFTIGTYVLFSSLIIISLMIPSYFVFKTGYPLSELAVILFSFQRMAPHISNAVRSRVVISSSKPAFEQIQNFEKEAKNTSSIDGNEIFKEFKNKIDFVNLSFNYPGKTNLFDKINLSFKKNTITGLVGPSGSGKTTIVDLLTGMLKPIDGEILVDGKNINSFKISTLRSRIGYIPQDPMLFNISIKENLLWANNSASEDEIWRALNFVEIDDFIRSLPEKLDTIVGDRGQALSGGQRQRIAFARAIIRKPHILIMDEATASIDQQTQELIENKVLELSKNTTVILISHSSNLIKKINKIYRIDNGIIKEGN
tara:strand:- start:285 stop:1985 length:1701 start_codon:yes stop_codon:yes gene_type:complete